VVTFETGTVSTIQLRQWSCVPREPLIKTVKLKLPDWLVYQPDGIIPDYILLSCFLRATVRHSGSDETRGPSGSQDVAHLQPKPFFSRPVKQHQLSLSWSKQMLQLTQRFLQKRCPVEQETIHLLSTIYASTGEIFGITKTLDPYSNELLEHHRIKAIAFPWCELSLWIFVTRHCKEKLCGVFHHIDSHNNYATPALFLGQSGQLHIQISGFSEESSAFLSTFTVPLNKWCQLSLALQKIIVFIFFFFYSLSHDVIFDDTEGYFVIGGGKFIQGVEGYFGPVVYYRVFYSDMNCFLSMFFFFIHMLCFPQAWLLALLAAQRDNRLALLHLGHLHQQGLHGFPKDPDLAYAYYANIAKQTTLDRQNPSPQQTFVEAIYLNDDETLNIQTNKDHHIFQWLKLQARRGAAEAEQALARMLFWGQQGLSPNIQEAVKHYERGAVQLEDPVSMYDYGIVLLLGQGVEKDVPKAVTFLKKAVEKEFVPAMNALAWYYEQYEKDYQQAVQLWEKADSLGSPDAPLNLGVLHSQGLYPGKPADQYVAYKYYLKSAERAHLRGAVSLADVWATGIPGYVARRPSDAVLWVKWTAEHNGYLGRILRNALDSYLKSDMFMALLYYMMAAESGYAPAQFNVAYLCEQNSAGFLDRHYATNYMWRYYNLTIQSQNPDTYGKMGDLLYEGLDGRQKDYFSAAQMYSKAALSNNPQGWYNLGLLVEEDYRLPLSILSELGLSDLYHADTNLLLSTMYQRCRDSDNTDSYLPCSLALFHIFLQSFEGCHIASVIKVC
uniref:Protein sel-1 homolog 3-like n=1 Tax=Cyprinodon variegatus TaxID=28743 RepID=A0A3Q2CCQ0_CYPVA